MHQELLTAEIRKTLSKARIVPALLPDCGGLQLYLLAEDFDLVLAADVLYDKANHGFLAAFLERAPEVLVADSRVRNLQVPPYVLLGEEDAGTLPDLNEFDEFRRVRFYRGQRP